MTKRIEVVGAVFAKNGKILAARRSKRMSLPGLWEFPGGKIEPGETAAQALQREITEEFKCDVEVRNHLTTTEYPYSFGTVSLATYFVDVVGADPVLTEHSEIRWLAPHELFDVEWAPADIPAVQMLVQQSEGA